MRVFLDTNVVLDVFTERAPHYRAAVTLWTLAEQGRVEGFVSAISYTTVYYIVRKMRDAVTARRALVLLRGTVTPVACDARLLHQAIDADLPDFEDAVQYFSAIRAGAQCLLTRDAGHFPSTGLPILSPDEFLATHRFE
jgi:predicted nucleic acid-binding protein